MTTARVDRPRRARATPTTIRTTTTPSPCPTSRAAHEKQRTRAGALAERRSAHTDGPTHRTTNDDDSSKEEGPIIDFLWTRRTRRTSGARETT